MDNYFKELNSINVQDKVEKKNGLTYLSWSFAWGELKKRHPDATYKIYENAEGYCYHTDGRTAWVKTGVTVNGIEHIEYLPIMDYKNKSISYADITSFDVNKAIQRSLTKAVARHGLGLYVYAGEDLPEAQDEPKKIKVQKTETKEDDFMDGLDPTDDMIELIQCCKTEEALKSLYQESKELITSNQNLLDEVTRKRKELRKAS